MSAADAEAADFPGAGATACGDANFSLGPDGAGCAALAGFAAGAAFFGGGGDGAFFGWSLSFAGDAARPAGSAVFFAGTIFPAAGSSVFFNASSLRWIKPEIFPAMDVFFPIANADAPGHFITKPRFGFQARLVRFSGHPLS